MASVRELKSLWQLRFNDVRRFPSEATVSISKAAYRTKTAARRYASHLEHRYHDPDDAFDPWRDDALKGRTRRGAPTLDEAAEEYVAYKKRLGEEGKRGGWNTHTYEKTASVILDFADSASGMAASLTSLQVEAFVYRPGLSQGAKRSYRRKIGTFLKWLHERGYNDRAEKPEPLVEKRKLPEFCTWSQLQVICLEHEVMCCETAKHTYAADPSFFSDVWNFAFFQGMRKEELAALRPEDVNLHRGLVRVGHETFTPKMSKDRVIPLTEPGRMIVEPYVRQSEPRYGRLFRRKSGQYFSRRFSKARAKAFPDRPRLTLHRLKNSCAIFWLQQGKDLIWVRDLLAHESVKTLEKYLRALGRTRRF